MKPVLLILDVQNDFFEAGNPNLPAFEAAVPVINEAIGLFRAANWAIVFVQHVSDSKPAGSQRWGISDRLDCRPIDMRMNKTTESAFWNTGLDSLLRSQRIGTVVVAGFIAERCVLSTQRGAAERGYEALLLDGGIAGFDDRYTQFTLDISPVITLDALRIEANE